ncbi:hypothetical protein [Wolbachia endosymbiont (group A) of Pogonocherus hispidulus]|uniref:hypothetical protein n=1 Tax=Wolbachia endosymbiont (group A) of Pogonocherus hispidulus TaxID=3066136 RepID=UPI00333FC7A6
MNIVTMVSASSLLYEHCDLRAISTRRMSSQCPDTGIQFLLPGKFSGFQTGMTSFTMYNLLVNNPLSSQRHAHNCTNIVI